MARRPSTNATIVQESSRLVRLSRSLPTPRCRQCISSDPGFIRKMCVGASLRAALVSAPSWRTIAITRTTAQTSAVMTELHGEFLMHFRAIFQTEVSNYYLDILRKAGGTPHHMAEIKATCWALVTKLLRVLFKEVHGVGMHAAGLEHVAGDPARARTSGTEFCGHLSESRGPSLRTESLVWGGLGFGLHDFICSASFGPVC